MHPIQLDQLQQQKLKSIFLSQVQALKQLYKKMHENIQQVERFLPHLRLYENILAEIYDFVPPEDCLKGEFTRLLSHPSTILRVVPEDAFTRGARSLPSPL